MGHAAELARVVGSVIASPNQADPGATIAGLSRKAGIQDRALGGHLYATASQYVELKLVMDSSRYGAYEPSAVKIYHYLTYKLHKSTQKARTKLAEAMGDATDEGRWQPVKQPRKLEAEVEALDQAADEIRIMSGDRGGRSLEISTWQTDQQSRVSTRMLCRIWIPRDDIQEGPSNVLWDSTARSN